MRRLRSAEKMSSNRDMRSSAGILSNEVLASENRHHCVAALLNILSAAFLSIYQYDDKCDFSSSLFNCFDRLECRTPSGNHIVYNND